MVLRYIVYKLPSKQLTQFPQWRSPSHLNVTCNRRCARDRSRLLCLLLVEKKSLGSRTDRQLRSVDIDRVYVTWLPWSLVLSWKNGGDYWSFQPDKKKENIMKKNIELLKLLLWEQTFHFMSVYLFMLGLSWRFCFIIKVRY